MKKTLGILVVVLAAAVTLATAVTAFGPSPAGSRPSAGPVFVSPLVGSTPDTTIRGIPSGAVPWLVDVGEVVLDGSGKLRVFVHGLLIVGPIPEGLEHLIGTTGSVTEVFASVSCEGEEPVDTQTVPLDERGTAEIHERIDLPTTCFGPIVLIRVGGIDDSGDSPAPWIAATGFGEVTEEERVFLLLQVDGDDGTEEVWGIAVIEVEHFPAFDRVEIRIATRNVPADGTVFEGWLVDRDTEFKLSLGTFVGHESHDERALLLEFEANFVRFTFAGDPYDLLVVTLEPMHDVDPRPAEPLAMVSIVD